jgi:hypothetical protein
MMDRENRLSLLLPEWGSNPVPFDPQSEAQPGLGKGNAPVEECKHINVY